MGEQGRIDDFDGFSVPWYTQVPNELFDRLLAKLSEAGLKVLLVAIRYTVGFHTEHRPMSLPFLVEKTGLSRNSVRKGLAECIEKRALVELAGYDSGRKTASVYTLRLREQVQNVTPSGSKSDQGTGSIIAPATILDSRYLLKESDVIAALEGLTAEERQRLEGQARETPLLRGRSEDFVQSILPGIMLSLLAKRE